MSFDPRDCEVVESQANGKQFWYCRTHKVEVEKDGGFTICPGPKPKEGQHDDQMMSTFTGGKWVDDKDIEVDSKGDIKLKSYRINLSKLKNLKIGIDPGLAEVSRAYMPSFRCECRTCRIERQMQNCPNRSPGQIFCDCPTCRSIMRYP